LAFVHETSHTLTHSLIGAQISQITQRGPLSHQTMAGEEDVTTGDALAAAGLLPLVFERLPPGEQCLTVARLGREWRAWAAARRAALHLGAWCRPYNTHSVPLWALQEAWPGLEPYGKQQVARRAARHGDAQAIEWMLATGGGGNAARDPALCSQAAAGGHLAVLQWLLQRGCRWGESTCIEAARSGRLAVLQWARQHGCPWGVNTSSSAADGGHLVVLQWLRQQGCPWDERTCGSAADGGHLAVLQWARQHGCPWDEYTCSRAAGSGHLAVLQWLRQHGCPWDKKECKRRAWNRGKDVLPWIDAQD
jgi:hypothetical protein